MTLKSERIDIGNGIGLNLVETNKFKSSLLSYYFIRPLSNEEVTKNALLPLVLKRGSREYKTNLKIQRELEENYGAKLSIGVKKKGEKQILRFSIETVNREYVQEKDYIYKVLNLIESIIFNPLIEGDCFKEGYVNQEKENLKNRIKGRINNKRSYAIDRCIEEMCKDEKFSIYSLGKIEDLDKIDGNILYKQYQEIINTSPIEVFYTGEYDDRLVEKIKETVNLKRGTLIDIPDEKIERKIQTKNMVEEDLDVAQGKLVLGYRAGIHHQSNLYNGLLLAADILGGGPNSKLFRNVREKESLAYYTNAMLYKYKSIMLVDGGIEFKDFDKTLDIVKQQIENVKDGIFTRKDIDTSKRSIRSSMESISDSIYLITEFFFSQTINEDDRNIEDIIRGIEEVERKEIIEAASNITLDTIYFMKNSNLEN